MGTVTADNFVIEVLNHHGRVMHRERIACVEGAGSATLGRSLAAEVLLDDAHVAPLHARVEVAEGRLRVSDLGSVNGIVVGGVRHHGASGLEVPDGLMQIGRTRIRVRLPGETLAPEKPELSASLALFKYPVRVAIIAAFAYIVLGIYSAWLSAPRDLAPVVVTALTTEAAAAAIWIFGWALVSRILLGEWRGWKHAALFLSVMATVGLLNVLLEIFWFMFSLSSVEHRESVLGVIVFMPLLFGHLVLASNLGRRSALLIAAFLPLAVGGSVLWVQMRGEERNVNYIGGNQVLYPPGLRLRAAAPLEDYFQRAGTLHDRAEARRKALPADEQGGEDDED